MVEPTLECFSKWKQNGISVSVVHLDNVVENILLKNCAASVDCNSSIEFDFTARNTPQQTASIAETAFYLIAFHGRAMLSGKHS
jgi:hypothetical protein